jgi:hypothetical protein
MYSIVDPKIFNVVDALNTELLKILAKEAFESVTCR